MRKFSGFLIAWVIVLSLGNAAIGAEEGWVFTGTTFIDRTAVDGQEEFDTRLQLHTRFGAGIDASRIIDLGGSRSFTANFGVSHERYPDEPRANRFFFDGGVMHVIPITLGLLRQIRLSGEATHARDEHDWVFNRLRVAAAARFQPAPRNNVQLRARLGYRDQNDAHTFVGYDQSEFLLDVMHNWRSMDGAWRINSTIYYERRNAERAVYSYSEVGARIAFLHTVTERITLAVRAAAFNRIFEDGGRIDKRFRATAGLQWDFEGLTADAFIGYQGNHSTLVNKRYRGGIFGVQLKHSF